MTLQLEHKNGNNQDYRLSNLCLLCPNCHSQTSTYAGGNRNAYNRPKYVSEIIKLLIYTDIKIDDIAFKFGLDRATVSLINNGHSYVDDSLSYPLRKRSMVYDKYCAGCGKKIKFCSKLCNTCEGLRRRELNKLPITRDELKDLIRVCSFTKIGETFNVSDNAIRKWCIKYNLPSSCCEIKSYTDEDWSSI